MSKKINPPPRHQDTKVHQDFLCDSWCLGALVAKNGLKYFITDLKKNRKPFNHQTFRFIFTFNYNIPNLKSAIQIL
jgi:hypothetical protein